MTWEPVDVIHEQWGRVQVVVGDLDVTYFRDVPIEIRGWSSGEPFGDARFTLVFPQITPFERVGVGDLWWLYEWENVDVYRVLPNGDVDRDNPLFQGMIASFDDSLGESEGRLALDIFGALYQADLYVHPPTHHHHQDVRVETFIKNELSTDKRPNLRTKPLKVEFPSWWGGSDDPNADRHMDAGKRITGFVLSGSGSWDNLLTGYIQEQLAIMQERDRHRGQLMWTMHLDPDRQPVLRIKDRSTTHWTISAGTPGVAQELSRDFTQAPNTIYGEGTDAAGTKWRNSYDVNKYRPLAITPAVDPTLDNTLGTDDEEPNPHFNPHSVRHEQHLNFGVGVSLAHGIESANRLINIGSNPGWYGTITLKIDPQEGSRFDMRAGQNLLLRHFRRFRPHRDDSFDALMDAEIFLDDNRFAPINRGQLASVLVRAIEYLEDKGLAPALPSSPSSHFTDTSGNVHETNINKLAEVGIALGFPDGTFRPSDTALRGQMAGFVRRTVEWVSDESLVFHRDYFTDILGSVFRGDINAAAEAGLVWGFADGTYEPQGPTRRINLGVVLQGMLRLLGDDIIAEKEGLLLHIAQVEADIENLTVTLTVDSRARDLLTLAELIERRAKDNRNPARMLRIGRESGMASDDRVPWDTAAGAGFIPRRASAMLLAGHTPTTPGFRPSDDETRYVRVNANAANPRHRWGFTRVLVQEYGDIYLIRLTAYNANGTIAPVPFHLGLYGNWMGGSMNVDFMPLDANGDPRPFSEGVFDQPDNIDPSRIVLWGEHGQRAGYWPGVESDGDPPTGVLVDEGGFSYTLPDGVTEMWAAIYCEHSAPVFFQGRALKGSD